MAQRSGEQQEEEEGEEEAKVDERQDYNDQLQAKNPEFCKYLFRLADPTKTVIGREVSTALHHVCAEAI